MTGNYYDDVDPTMLDSPRPSARLVVEYGPWSGKSFPLDKPSQIIGRAPECDIVLEDREVSRRNSRLFWRNAQLFIEDLGSANGTLVNGAAISAPQILYATDKIEIGASTIAVQGLPAGLPAAAPAVSYSPPAQVFSAQAQPQQNNRTLWILISGLVVAVLLFLLAVAAYLYVGRSAPADVAAGGPAVTIVSPPNGVEVPVNVPVSVQATASDQQGVVRIELWADGTLVSQQASQVAGGESLLLLNIPWTPTIPGNHVLEVRAYNAVDQQNQTSLVTLNAIAPPAQASPGVTVILQATDTPTTTPIPSPSPQGGDSLPTATPTGVATVPGPTATPQPSLRALAGVNVREGPGTAYQVKGVLAEGQVVQPLGRSPDGGWWQIIFPPGSGSLGWVSGAYVQSNDQALSLPIVAPPPLPLTATFTPPPVTATPTSIPTPAVTVTPPADISFTVDDSTLSAGQCTVLRWRVKNVKAYWIDGIAGVGDEGAKQICDPVGVTTHVLRVQKLDDSVQEYTLTVSVGTGGNVPVPALVAPENNKEFDYYPREVTFVWSPVSAPGSVWYNIEIEWNGGASWQTYALVQSLSSTAYTMNNFVGANPGRWRVWATSSSLGDGPKSDWRYFRFLR